MMKRIMAAGIAVLALLALPVLPGCLGDNRGEYMASNDTRAIPPIDAAAPSVTETATFATG